MLRGRAQVSKAKPPVQRDEMFYSKAGRETLCKLQGAECSQNPSLRDFALLELWSLAEVRIHKRSAPPKLKRLLIAQVACTVANKNSRAIYNGGTEERTHGSRREWKLESARACWNLVDEMKGELCFIW